MCWKIEDVQFFLSPSKTNLIVSCNLTFFTMAQKELSDNSLKRPESTWATNSSPLPKFCTGLRISFCWSIKVERWKYKGSIVRILCSQKIIYCKIVLGGSTKYVKLIFSKAVFWKIQGKNRTTPGVVLIENILSANPLYEFLLIESLFFFLNELSSLLVKSKYVRNILN